MQRLDVLKSGHQFLGCGLVVLGLFREGGLCVCLFSFLGCDGLGISGALFGGISHELLVLLLCKLLLSLSFSHLSVKVFDERVNHANDTTALLTLLGVCSWGLRSSRRYIQLLVRGHLHKRGSWCLVKLGVVELVQAIFCKRKNV